MPDYSLSDLAKLAGVTPRTIRFYIVQGLLPSPDQQGQNTRYTDEHLARLLAIKRLQAAHLPLAEIRQQLRAVPDDQLATLTTGDGPTPSQGSAVDYIRGILGRPAAAMPSTAAPPTGQAAPTQPEPEPPEPTRSQWERVSLTPDIELHVRRPLTRGDNKRVNRLIEIARQLFEED